MEASKEEVKEGDSSSLSAFLSKSFSVSSPFLIFLTAAFWESCFGCSLEVVLLLVVLFDWSVVLSWFSSVDDGLAFRFSVVL